MPKSIIVEGKTTAEAIEKGLKELNATKNMVEIKTIEEEKKRSFYSILAPRVVKIEMTLKEEKNIKTATTKKRQINKNLEEIEKISEKIKEFFNSILEKDVKCDVKIEDFCIVVKINGDNISHLIGYRGATINALQVLATAIANKHSTSKTVVIVDVGDYREKKKKNTRRFSRKNLSKSNKNKKINNFRSNDSI